jgi:hypothetical protein
VAPLQQFDVEKATDWTTLMTFIGGIIGWVVLTPARIQRKMHQIFYTKHEIDDIFLAKHTRIGSQDVEIKGASELFVSVNEWYEMRKLYQNLAEKHEQALEDSAKNRQDSQEVKALVREYIRTGK